MYTQSSVQNQVKCIEIELRDIESFMLLFMFRRLVLALTASVVDYQAGQNFSPTRSTFELPASLSPVNFPEQVQSTWTRSSSQHETKGLSNVKAFESLATTIAKDEWRRHTQQQLRQLQLAEEEKYSKSNHDEEPLEFDEKSPDSSFQQADSDVQRYLQGESGEGKLSQADRLLDRKSRSPINRDYSSGGAREKTEGSSSNQNTPLFQLPELGLPLPALQITTHISDVDVQMEPIQTEFGLGQAVSRDLHQNKTIAGTENSNPRAVSPNTLAFIHKRAASCLDRTESTDFPINRASRASNPLPASFDRKARVKRTSLGLRKRLSPIKTEHQVDIKQLENTRHGAETAQQEMGLYEEAELSENRKPAEKQEQPDQKELPENQGLRRESEQLEKPEQLETSKQPEKSEQREGIVHNAEGEHRDDSSTSIPPLALNLDESLFSDLTSMANSLRNRSTSFAFPVRPEKGIEARSRSSSVIQDAASIPNTPKSTRSNSTLNNKSPSHGGKTGSFYSLHVAKGSPRAFIAHDMRRASPDHLKLPGSASVLDLKCEQRQAPKYQTLKGHRYELSSDSIPSVNSDLAELSAEPVSPSRYS